MSDRERWTVYPLLFLALGLAMRAVLVPPAEMGELDVVRLLCREIVVKDGEGRVMLHLGRVAEGGGRIEINDAEGDARMSLGSCPPQPSAAIEFAGDDGEVIRRIGPIEEER
jgi:hypothetical protein